MKILYVTTVGVTMCFFPEHIKMLLEHGHTVELACNDAESEIPEIYRTFGLKTHTIPFSRSPLDKSNIKAYKKLKELVNREKYDIVHTHTPNASIITRLACSKLRRQGLKVFYTAHGFHFYKGAPAKNWMLFYPLEKLCSYKTDVLITINDEDYECAKNKMHAEKTEMIPGVGIDLEKFAREPADRESLRKELGVSADSKLLVYIAELNRNKNQMSLLEMMSVLKKDVDNAVLLFVGKGDMKSAIENKARELGVSDRIIFTGFRKDIARILKSSDVCVPASIREGLGMNVLESMASGVPVVAYDNRGHRTVIQNGENGYIVPNGDYTAMAERVKFVLDNPDETKKITDTAFERIGKYSIESSLAKMSEIYGLGNR